VLDRAASRGGPTCWALGSARRRSVLTWQVTVTLPYRRPASMRCSGCRELPADDRSGQRSRPQPAAPNCASPMPIAVSRVSGGSPIAMPTPSRSTEALPSSPRPGSRRGQRDRLRARRRPVARGAGCLGPDGLHGRLLLHGGRRVQGQEQQDLVNRGVGDDGGMPTTAPPPSPSLSCEGSRAVRAGRGPPRPPGRAVPTGDGTLRATRRSGARRGVRPAAGRC
jgi:hypothetical protein